MATLWDGAEIKLLHTVQTINSILNLAASGGKQWGWGELRWSHVKCSHMLIIYLGGFTDSTRESDTCWRNNRGGMYKLVNPMERRHNKLCFQAPLLLFPVLLKHVCSTGTRQNCLNCATSLADQACHGNMSWKCVFKKNKTASLDCIFFFLSFFNPAMSEP